MNRELLEGGIKYYFKQEGVKGDLSSRQWEEVLSHVKKQKQRRWLWGPLTPLTARPILAMAASLVLAVVVGGTALWVAAPWEGIVPGTPRPVDGPRAIPAPRYFAQSWMADKNLITPGEPVTITLTLKNTWDKRIEFKNFPKTVALNQVDTRSEEAVPVALVSNGVIPGLIEPGEEVTVVANVTSDVTAGLQSGRYNARFEIRFAYTPGKPEMGEVGLGLNSPILFVVLPPEGALDTTVQVGEVREVNGVRITLDTIHFTPEKTTILALAALPAAEPAGPAPVIAPIPTSAGPSQGTPTPTAVPVLGPTGSISGLTAQYRIDGGTWHELRGHGYRSTPEGVRHEWTFGPVSANASTFEFAIMSDTDTGSGATGLWGWTVPLQGAQ